MRRSHFFSVAAVLVAFSASAGGCGEGDQVRFCCPRCGAKEVRLYAADVDDGVPPPLPLEEPLLQRVVTVRRPAQPYIDDDLFGFMDAAKGGTHKRTSPVRVSPLLGLDPYAGDLDFGTNYMSVESGGNPNIFETEIHGGLYRGSVLIELDAVGVSRRGEGVSANKAKEAWAIDAADKVNRVSALLTALQHLWSSGRQSRFLADLSPKFVASAVTTAKSPIFLESVVPKDDGIDTTAIAEVVADSKAILVEHCFGVRAGTFTTVPDGTLTVGDAFSKMNEWIKTFYGA